MVTINTTNSLNEGVNNALNLRLKQTADETKQIIEQNKENNSAQPATETEDTQTSKTTVQNTPTVSKEEQRKWLINDRANNAIGRVVQYRDADPEKYASLTDADLDAIATGGGSAEGDLRAFQKLHGITRGTGSFFGNLSKKTSYTLRQAVDDYVAKRDEANRLAQEQQKATALSQNGSNGTLGSYTDTNGVKHNIPDMRGLFKEMGDYLNTLERNPKDITPEKKKRYQILFNQLRGKLEQAGIDVSDMRILKEDAIIGEQTLGGVGDLLKLLGGAQADEVENILLANGVKPTEDGGIQFPHNKTWEEIQLERQQQKEQGDLMIQQRELQRQKNRTGLADIAAVIGDMMKAAGGAPVTARDYSKIYDNLTAQQKANYDAYVTRMEKAKQDARAERLRKEELAIAEKYREQQQDNANRQFREGVRQFDETMEYNKDRDERNRQNKLAIANAKAANRDDTKNYSYIAWNGTYYAYPKEKAKAKAQEIITKYWDKVRKDMITLTTGITIGNNGPVFGNGVKWGEAISVCIDLLNNPDTKWTEEELTWISNTLSSDNVYGQQTQQSQKKDASLVKKDGEQDNTVSGRDRFSSK